VSKLRNVRRRQHRRWEQRSNEAFYKAQASNPKAESPITPLFLLAHIEGVTTKQYRQYAFWTVQDTGKPFIWRN